MDPWPHSLMSWIPACWSQPGWIIISCYLRVPEIIFRTCWILSKARMLRCLSICWTSCLVCSRIWFYYSYVGQGLILTYWHFYPFLYNYYNCLLACRQVLINEYVMLVMLLSPDSSVHIYDEYCHKYDEYCSNSQPIHGWDGRQH